MKNNFFTEWINSKIHPMPRMSESHDVWKNFIDKTTNNGVKKAFRKNCKLSICRNYMENLYIILKRLSKGDWPSLSEDFVCRYISLIYYVTSRETAKFEIQSCRFDSPMLLVDKNRKMIGILIDKDTVITGFTKESIYSEMAAYLNKKDMLPTKKQMRLIDKHKENIDKLLNIVDLKLGSNYWVRDGRDVVVWEYLAWFRPVVNKSDLACLLFVL